MRVIEAILEHAKRRPRVAAAVECFGGANETLTWSRLASDAEQVARDSAWGVRDTILLSLPNGVAYLVHFVAALIAGARVFPTHPSLKQREIDALAAAAGATWIVRPGVRSRQAGPAHARTHPLPSRPGPAVILQSSGTTGLPRLALREAAALDAVAQCTVQAIGLCESHRVLAAMPLGHSYGVDTTLASLLAGSRLDIFTTFDAAAAAALLASGRSTPPSSHSPLSRAGRNGRAANEVSASEGRPDAAGASIAGGSTTRPLRSPPAPDGLVFPCVPVMLEALARVPPMRPIRGCLAYSAGTHLPARIANEMEERWGVRVGQLYGATELGSVTFNHPDAPGFDPGNVGLPMQGVSIRVLSDSGSTRRELAAGEEGELAVRAPSMLTSYLDGEPSCIDGHFLTGDLGRVDSRGRLTITGRLKLLIDVGGLKVNPLEVERVLCEHPGVRECIIIPEPMSDTITKLRAVLTPRPDRNGVRVDELRAFARERLAPYKVPRVFEFVDDLPRTATGKVRRSAVAGVSP